MPKLSCIRWLFVCACFLMAFFSLRAQADSILILPKEQRQLALFEWFEQKLRDSDPNKLIAIENLLQKLKDKRERALSRMMRSLLLYYQLKHTKLSKDQKLAVIDEATNESIAHSWKDLEAESIFWRGEILFESQEFGAGLESMMKGLIAQEKTGWSNPFISLYIYNALGNAYYTFGDMELAITTLKSIDPYKVPATYAGYTSMLNTIGLAYQQLMKHDSALHYYMLAKSRAQQMGDSFWVALITGNIGSLYFQSGQTDSAYAYLKADYEGSIQAGILGSAVNAGSLLAHLELQRGNIPRAEEYIHFSRMHMDTANLDGMIGYLENMYDYSKLTGDYRQAVNYADTLSVYKGRKEQLLGKNVMEKARMRVQASAYQAEVDRLEFSKSRQLMLRNALMALVAMLGTISILIIKRHQLVRRMEADKLRQAEKELNAYAASLVEKNELIQYFRNEINEMQDLGYPADHERTARISAMIHSNIQTDEDWRHFRKLFDAVYPGYLVRLREKIPDLTQAEIRLIALTKLEIPSKDMGDILGISPDSIRKSRYRLRKKLNLPEDGDLGELVRLI